MSTILLSAAHFLAKRLCVYETVATTTSYCSYPQDIVSCLENEFLFTMGGTQHRWIHRGIFKATQEKGSNVHLTQHLKEALTQPLGFCE